MVAPELSNQVCIDVQRRRKPHLGAEKRGFITTSREHFIGGDPVSCLVEKPRVQVEEQTEAAFHHDPIDDGVTRRTIPGALQQLHGLRQVMSMHQQIDVAQGPLDGIVVEPVLKESSFERHDRDASCAESPSDVAH